MTPQEQLELLRASKNENLPASKRLKIMRAIKSGEGSVDEILGNKNQGLSAGNKVMSFDDMVQQSSNKDEGFDYETGAASGLRAKLSFMETAEEKEDLLRRIVGEDGYTKDSKGLLALTEAGQLNQGMEPIGQNLVIEDEGFSFGDVADLAGLAPETIGSVIGGILGAPGLVTGAVGAAGGAALGQSVEEGIESLLGLQKQSLGEVGMDVAKEAALAGTLDFGGNLIFKLAKGAFGLAGRGANAGARAIGQVEREIGADSAELGLKILDEGGLPSYEAAGLPAFVSKTAAIAQTVGGGEQKRALANIRFALNKRDKMLGQAGISNSDDLAKVIKNSVPAKAKQLENSLKSSQDAHMKAIDDTISMLTKTTKTGGEIDDFVLESLVKNYEEFMKQSKIQFNLVDDSLSQVKGKITLNGVEKEVTGSELPLFDIKAMKTRFDDIIENQYAGASKVAPEEFLEIGRQIDQLNSAGAKEGFTTFNGFKELRKNINDTLMDPALSIKDTTPRRLLNSLKGDIDRMMDPSNYKNGGYKLTGVGGNQNAKKVKKAMGQLLDARASYRSEIKLFNDLETLGIIRNLGDAGENVKLTAGKLFDRITDSPKRISAVLNSAGSSISQISRDELRQTLAKSYLDDALLVANKDFGDPLAFNGVQFNNKIRKLGKSGKLLFGDQWGEVQSLAKSLSYNGVKKIDDQIMQRIVSQNPNQNIISTLKKVQDAQIGLDKSLSTKALRNLADGTIAPEEAATLLLSRDTSASQMDRVMQFFGDNDAARETIKRAIISDILGSVDEEIFANVGAASSLRKALEAYKPDMLNKVLGKQQVIDIKEFSKMLEFLSDTGRTGAGGLAAQSIRTGMVTAPGANLKKGIKFKALNHILNNPNTIRKALEFKAGRTSGEATVQSLSQIINESVAQVTGSGVPITERASGLGRGIVGGLKAANRGKTAIRQAGARALLADQEARGTVPTPNPIDIPEVSMPMENIPEVRLSNEADPNQKFLRQQMNLRERAKSNPYIAATLLGGLGNADLL